jgi:cyanophycinase-like exopeptidase
LAGSLQRVAGAGWIALLGGGEFSFEETLDADRAWLEKCGPGLIGFVPAASDSADYGKHFATYLAEAFERQLEVIPIYRSRDGRRAKNAERIAACAAIYLGGGVTDNLLDAVMGTPVAVALAEKLASGGVVAGIAAGAQVAGMAARSIFGGGTVPALGWLPGGVVETNFDPAHDRRLRKLLASPGISWGLGIATGGAVLLGPDEQVEVVGTAFLFADAEGDPLILGEEGGSGTPAEPTDEPQD